MSNFLYERADTFDNGQARMHESSFTRGVKQVRQAETPRFENLDVLLPPWGSDALSLVAEDGLCVQSTAWRFRPDGLIGRKLKINASLNLLQAKLLSRIPGI